MAESVFSSSSISNAWDVLMLFLIPVGGGIPAGVLMARSRGIEWPWTMGLYFLSDLILACAFEPLMLLVIAAGKRFRWVERVREAFKRAKKNSASRQESHLGNRLGPLALIMISFGVDPMTGRTTAAAAGHGFVSGWTLAIAGDMIYFAVLMASTLWLNSVLGDGTKTTVIILVAMMVVPYLIRRFRERHRGSTGP